MNDQDRINKVMEKLGFYNQSDFIYFLNKYNLLQNLEKQKQVKKLISDIDNLDIMKEISKFVSERIKNMKGK